MRLDEGSKPGRAGITAVAKQRVYRNRLRLAFDRDVIELDRSPIRRRHPRFLAENDADPVILRLAFEPRRQIDRVAQHRIVEPAGRAHIADDAVAGVDADPDIERLERATLGCRLRGEITIEA